MQVYQINVVLTTIDETEEGVRERLESMLEGSGFGVACVERDYEQEDTIDTIAEQRDK